MLKLSDLEEQFKILTNRFEEINFKLDKLSNRITKVQTRMLYLLSFLVNVTKTNWQLQEQKITKVSTNTHVIRFLSR